MKPAKPVFFLQSVVRVFNPTLTVNAKFVAVCPARQTVDFYRPNAAFVFHKFIFARSPIVKIADERDAVCRIVVIKENCFSACHTRRGESFVIKKIRFAQGLADGEIGANNAEDLAHRRETERREAVEIKMFLTAAGVKRGFASSICATMDATIGAAKLVPSTC